MSGRIYYCPLCPRTFTTYFGFKRHFNCMHYEAVYHYVRYYKRCFLCGREARDWESFLMHLARVYDEEHTVAYTLLQFRSRRERRKEAIQLLMSGFKLRFPSPIIVSSVR